MPRPRIDWRPILLEAGFVILGVVLALAANEWRKEVLDRRGAATAMQSIREELRSNRDAVQASVEYHVGLSDSLVSLVRRNAADRASPPTRPDGRLFARGFFHPATLLHTAWDAGRGVAAPAGRE